MAIQKHPDHSLSTFVRRTISAQIHFVAFLLALAGLVVILVQANLKPDRMHFWVCLVYGISGILVFAMSSFYHFLSDGFILDPKVDRWLENFDHFTIYFFIAGTYTPFVYNMIDPPWSRIILVTVWFVALFGSLYTRLKPRLPGWLQHRYTSTILFVLMGWTIVIRIHEIFEKILPWQLFFLVAGGLSYTFGAVIYAKKKPDWWPGVFGFHEIWHVAVVAGFAFHYALVLSFYI